MKRFITYLYEYKGKQKGKNIGFIRVNVRGLQSDMQINIQNCCKKNETGILYALTYKKELLGLALGELRIRNSQCEGSVTFETENIMNSACALNDVVGVIIRLPGEEYFASCWKDEFAEEIARGNFSVVEELKDTAVLEEDVATVDIEATITYDKIHLDQIRDLPSPNWHLATNSFLLHGFANYGYLVLKKEMENGKETLSLGVPGIFEKPEAVMAILFGFPDFEEIPSKMEMNARRNFSDIKKNQEPKLGTFGGWFVELKN